MSGSFLVTDSVESSNPPNNTNQQEDSLNLNWTSPTPHLFIEQMHDLTKWEIAEEGNERPF